MNPNWNDDNYTCAIFKKKGNNWIQVCIGPAYGGTEYWRFGYERAKTFLKQIQEGRYQGHSPKAIYKIFKIKWEEVA